MTDIVERLKLPWPPEGGTGVSLPGWVLELMAEAAATIVVLDDECQQSMVEIARERDRAERAEAQLAEARRALDAVFEDTQARTKAGMTYGINGHPTLSPATLHVVAQARFAAHRTLTGDKNDGSSL